MPASAPVIYLDHAATTHCDAVVADAVMEAMQTCIANPSAAYGAAGLARKAMRLARETVATALGCDRNEVFFTSCGTEANNWVFRSMSGRHVVVSAIEHSSVLEAATGYGCKVTLVKPDKAGRISAAAIERALQPDTALISVQYINNETGVLQPVEEIGQLARSKRILYHCDAVQAFGHIPVGVKAAGAAFLTASAHKFYGPRGIGFLYCRTGTPLTPMLYGGGQENARRSGTENVPGMVGLRVATELALADMAERAEREKQVLKRLTKRVMAAVPSASILGEGCERAPGVCAMLLPGLSAEKAIAELDMKGILVSGGAACAARSSQPSHVYRAMGLSEKEASQVLRFSPGRHTSLAMADTAADALIEIYYRMQA